MEGRARAAVTAPSRGGGGMAHPVAEGEGRGRGLVWGEIPGGEVGGGICGRLPSSHGRGRDAGRKTRAGGGGVGGGACSWVGKEGRRARAGARCGLVDALALLIRISRDMPTVSSMQKECIVM